jgi:hypothetical protein
VDEKLPNRNPVEDKPERSEMTCLIVSYELPVEILVVIRYGR